MRLLDLFCCEGGAGMGYSLAGFEVVGVDIEPQPRYPFEFHQADAIAYLLEHGHEFDVIHASPPCQAYSVTKHSHSNVHPDLLAPTREALIRVGRPYIIENVPGAPMLEPVMLCASMFGLRAADTDGTELALRRHRLFETSWPIVFAPSPCVHDSTKVGGSYGGGRNKRPEDRDKSRRGGYTPATEVRAALIGAGWMTRHGLAQAIPPAYTQWLGHQALASMLVANHADGSTK